MAWSYDSHDAFKDSEMQSNPIIVDGVLYATTPTLKVVALDCRNRARGVELRASGRRSAAAPISPSRRDGLSGRVFFTYRNFLYALDRKAGKPIPSFGTEVASTCARAWIVRRKR